MSKENEKCKWAAYWCRSEKPNTRLVVRFCTTPGHTVVIEIRNLVKNSEVNKYILEGFVVEREGEHQTLMSSHVGFRASSVAHIANMLFEVFLKREDFNIDVRPHNIST